MRKLRLVLILCLLGASIAPASWAKQKTYLAIGDSYGFGYTTDSPNFAERIAPSYGAPGYVQSYARVLDPRSSDSQNILKVVNLSVPGESTDTFFTGGSLGVGANLHYHPFLYPAPLPPEFEPSFYYTNAVSQHELLLKRIAEARAAQSDIHRVTIHLGGNDLQALLSNPAFYDPSTSAATLEATLNRVDANFERLLTTLRQAAPEARVVLLGYPNPFRALGPEFEALTDPAVQGFNARIAELAARFGARYVDVYTPFLGHEGEWTYILQDLSPSPVAGAPAIPNAHPNAAGYAVIADLLAAQE